MENASNPNVSQDSASNLSDIISLISSVSDSSSDSPDSNFLTSLKPYLSPKRQKKIDQCEKVIMLTGTLKLLNELHFFDGTNEPEEK